ncbi:MAG: hypothetical protein ONB46_03215 [candidate division KSB1 bacterium]|nr:hypothetical protein [candidate division KSB1 bacterium]MDZ7365067.1 hypothetical protein [candidate division KSB1 bacterium]MDZ7403461.1 hypothetical protein [candidate division KSB1 bacterium]
MNKSPATSNRLGVRMHGASLTLESTHAPLLDYAVEHLHDLVETPGLSPDVAVKCHWSQGDWDPEANPFPSSEAVNVIGKRMLGNPDELVWLDTLRMKGLQLRFRRDQGRWLFEVAYRFHPKKEKAENLPEYEYKKYFSLMSYLVYYPLMWHLERSLGWTVFHASALASPAGGILIGGLGGVGKTTTCVALMQRPGIELVAENIIFTDGEWIYPCYEPIRLDENSLAMLGNDLQGLAPMTFPEGLKDKSLFHLRANGRLNKVKPAALFLPQFSPRRYLTPLPPPLAAEKMAAMNRLTRELDDYAWYAAALEMHWPQAGQAAKRLEVLRRFAEATRCFELGIDRTAGVEAVVMDILNAIDSLESFS